MALSFQVHSKWWNIILLFILQRERICCYFILMIMFFAFVCCIFNWKDNLKWRLIQNLCFAFNLTKYLSEFGIIFYQTITIRVFFCWNLNRNEKKKFSCQNLCQSRYKKIFFGHNPWIKIILWWLVEQMVIFWGG